MISADFYKNNESVTALLVSNRWYFYKANQKTMQAPTAHYYKIGEFGNERSSEAWEPFV